MCVSVCLCIDVYEVPFYAVYKCVKWKRCVSSLIYVFGCSRCYCCNCCCSCGSVQIGVRAYSWGPCKQQNTRHIDETTRTASTTQNMNYEMYLHIDSNVVNIPICGLIRSMQYLLIWIHTYSPQKKTHRRASYRKCHASLAFHIITRNYLSFIFLILRWFLFLSFLWFFCIWCYVVVLSLTSLNSRIFLFLRNWAL